MVEVPDNAEGLSWIVSQESLQLLLLPGLQTASITAAAAGDQQALSYLRFIAQYSAAHHSMLNFTELDRACSEASAMNFNDSDKIVAFEHLLHMRGVKVQLAFHSRRISTIKIQQKAVCHGNLTALKWLRALCHRTYGDDAELLQMAAGGGHLDILKYLLSGPCPAPWDEAVASAAVSHPACLQWLLSQQDCRPLPESIAEDAAKFGGLESLKILSATLPVASWGFGVAAGAAAHPDGLAMLQWLQAQTSIDGDVSPWDARTCSAAARAGNLGLLQWLRLQEQNCPWDKGCTAGAAEAGSVDILHWLRTRSPCCPWGRSCITKAAANGHLEVLKYLVAHDAPRPQDSEFTEKAARRGHLAVLQLLSSHGFPLPGTLYWYAAYGGHSHVLKWLYSQKVAANESPGFSVTYGSQPDEIYVPILLFLGDITTVMLGQHDHKQLVQARRTLCTFHGLLRWCRRAVSDPSKGMHRAFDCTVNDTSGQNLLVRLSMLPQELAERIAVAAGIQHDFFA